MAHRLDRTDLKMLRLLQNNGRLSNAELAEAVVSDEAISNTNCAAGSPSASSVSGPVSWAEEVKR